MNEAPEEPTGIEARSKAEFDASVGGLNAHVRSRLTQARFAAIEELERKRRSRWRSWWMPAAGFVTAAVIVASISMPGMNRSMNRTDGAAVQFADDDMPMVLEDNIEMLEDLEFYAWLDDEALAEHAAPSISPASEPARS